MVSFVAFAWLGLIANSVVLAGSSVLVGCCFGCGITVLSVVLLAC